MCNIHKHRYWMNSSPREQQTTNSHLEAPPLEEKVSSFFDILACLQYALINQGAEPDLIRWLEMIDTKIEKVSHNKGCKLSVGTGKACFLQRNLLASL